MDLKFVETLVGVLERSSALSEIEYSDGERHLRLQRAWARPGIQRETAAGATAVRQSGAPVAPSIPSAPTAAAPAARKHTIAAGMIGTFYRSPAPDHPAFVAVGDTVAEGQTLAIVEAMKLLNPVDADRSGRVAEILVADGDSVSTETPLFVLEELEGLDV
ncbi:acetyl-CoA carboxylase biotin carboxyl carrier protein [Cupriavidus sp. SW-Y-13]|uniref:acetyl-CoA carboxylase biotin carboxyl carrier protein n=1 Tax=Cupriavidus sp. SW-Y-13 TaxID=2653854 RepID=UPI00136537C6|nr:acetyl-CoA carboxylase biotin carboxyl carrier protein [Cupriavidus sp. SW-Y-13]MWL91484.1 acetyl-CoA carboxylase biotin carboxyl carrier protein [Cupriavidus sp. SW-Y-13]